VNWQAALRLGRVSNLPTVWTNVLAGMVICGGAPRIAPLLAGLVSMSLFYTAGMFLNDAFDRQTDRRERRERPIPAGEVSASAVFTAGFGMLLLALLVLVAAGYFTTDGTGWRAPAAGLGLAMAIVLYDWHHKANPLSPLLMGACRMLVYVTGGFIVARALPGTLIAAALVLLCYLIGLTYAAKQENLNEIGNTWPLLFLAAPFIYLAPVAADTLSGGILYVAFALWVLFALSFLLRRDRINVPRAVISLIAGISLLDAVLIAGQGQPALDWLAAGAFVLTLALQRFVPGT
jgi:4-hydroxybenzoate polyprenyltransferase